MLHISLLDYLTLEMGNEFISDFRVKRIRKEKLRFILEYKVDFGQFTEREWRDACGYITGEETEDLQQARECLLHFCKEKNTGRKVRSV